MGAALLVAAIGLLLQAEPADSDRRVTELGNTFAGATYEDPGAGGTPWRVAAGVTGGLGAILLIGAAAYQPPGASQS